MHPAGRQGFTGLGNGAHCRVVRGSGGGTGSPWGSKRLRGQGDGWEEPETLTAHFRPLAGIEKASGQAIL